MRAESSPPVYYYVQNGRKLALIGNNSQLHCFIVAAGAVSVLDRADDIVTSPALRHCRVMQPGWIFVNIALCYDSLTIW